MRQGTSTEPRWVGPIPNGIAAYTFKKDIPKQFDYAAKKRIDFGLYGRAYVPFWDGAILTRDGREVVIHEACLNTPGFVIGIRDIEAAGNLPWAEEWRVSMHARIEDRLAVPE